MTAAAPGNIGLAELWHQGQGTQERIARLEVIVEQLAKVDERLDSHSGRLRDLEAATVRQEGDAADIKAVMERQVSIEKKHDAVAHQVSRIIWLPPLAAGLIATGGAYIVGRIFNGG
ncbi:hypothetical protein G7068_11970 [Leucobacter viscericola]|uniref:Uncharacterized protein n=1 Tax=Leucobacter viscericola TaxID=2714935 RepID=A0A6G7XH72_9MICO|nr:hypothetical protein [Leucobacter viscericola]QIK63826.1 hypothetical protein G7068_11970 [Leucobacter viscericola]